jgi:hypothetical protein
MVNWTVSVVAVVAVAETAAGFHSLADLTFKKLQ